MKTLINTKIKSELKVFVLLSVLSILLFALQSCTEDNQGTGPSCETDPSLCTIQFDYQTYHSVAEITNFHIKYYEDGSSNLQVQVFQVEANADRFRPLVLLAPGGAWTSYTRVNDIKDIAFDLARRGYVVGVVDYSIKVGGQSWDPETIVKSVLDVKASVKFFKKNASMYGIDPDKIFTGGWSSGAQASLISGHMSEQDFEESSPDLKALLEGAFETHGFEPGIYEDYSSSVKGTLILMPWTADLGILDTDGPALMMIAHPLSYFNGGVRLWGEFSLGGSTLYGPDLIREQALSVGYTEGADLHCYIMDAEDQHAEHINYSPLMPQHYDQIAEFFYKNLN